MAQLENVGQGRHAVVGPMLASAMLLVGLLFALLGIKIWGFRRRLTFDRSGGSSRSSPAQAQQAPPRYAAQESQVNGTDNAVHGVFRQRNLEEFESSWPSSTSTVNSYLAGSVPNLRMGEPAEVLYRAPPQTQRRRRKEVLSAHSDSYSAPPTRMPPSPPTRAVPPADLAVAVAPEPPSELGMPNFDHFAEKYALISAAQQTEDAARTTQLRSKDSGRYVKFDPVDDVPELLTPEDDQGGTSSLSVTAVVHRGAPPADEHESEMTSSSQEAGDQSADSAFVVAVIAGSPEATTPPQATLGRSLFDDLELPSGEQDPEFVRIRSSFVMNEADILDLPAAGSPPGFGKSIEEDWENWENLDAVAEVPEPNWALHPGALEQLPPVETTLSEATLSLDNVEQLPPVETTLSEATLALDNLEQVEGLFHQLELMEPAPRGHPEAPPDLQSVEPPPYDPGPLYLPDYESLMQLEDSRASHTLPKYTEAVGGERFVSSIEDLYAELETNGGTGPSSSEAPTNGIDNFEDLCQEMAVAGAVTVAEAEAEAPRPAPQPAPRSTKTSTLNVRGDAAPLPCYHPEELPGSSSSEDEAPSAPRPAQRNPRTLRVRFDVENLQYYQSAEVVASSSGESEEDRPPPRPMMRSTIFEPEPEPEPGPGHNSVPSLFGAQVSQEDSSDDEAFGRAISQHRTMTAALRTMQNDTDA
ncbi:uncharacterized protein [Drosophila pseudoobscura]|uniref:Flocculation protein FLO11 n=1 Tax=Drosophila pseudoobscura pseudoobscura TaxID=46245 RepID=A0A6I8UBB1_DROPS|nr:uncharacterized protein LOC4812599 [Drosophila pseudoobscura]